MKAIYLLLFLLLIRPSSSFGLNLSTKFSVSGLSSGGFMATQLHIAFSEQIDGVAVLAAGPYACADGNALVALNHCMRALPFVPQSSQLRLRARQYESLGLIAPLQNLVDDRLFLMHGKSDNAIHRNVILGVPDFYLEVPSASIKLVDHLDVGHAFPTLSFGNDCGTANASPWMSACGYDLAGVLLQHLLGDLNERGIVDVNNYYRFKQASAPSFDQWGYVYIPTSCQSGEQCRIHLALHGCMQGSSEIGEVFVRHAGFNEWAEANNIVVVYPQVKTDRVVGNPNGCWDWWGYSSAWYATRQAPQMKALIQIISNLRDGEIDLVRTP